MLEAKSTQLEQLLAPELFARHEARSDAKEIFQALLNPAFEATRSRFDRPDSDLFKPFVAVLNAQYTALGFPPGSFDPDSPAMRLLRSNPNVLALLSRIIADPVTTHAAGFSDAVEAGAVLSPSGQEFEQARSRCGTEDVESECEDDRFKDLGDREEVRSVESTASERLSTFDPHRAPLDPSGSRRPAYAYIQESQGLPVQTAIAAVDALAKDWPEMRAWATHFKRCCQHLLPGTLVYVRYGGITVESTPAGRMLADFSDSFRVFGHFATANPDIRWTDLTLRLQLRVNGRLPIRSDPTLASLERILITSLSELSLNRSLGGHYPMLPIPNDVLEMRISYEARFRTPASLPPVFTAKEAEESISESSGQLRMAFSRLVDALRKRASEVGDDAAAARSLGNLQAGWRRDKFGRLLVLRVLKDATREEIAGDAPFSSNVCGQGPQEEARLHAWASGRLSAFDAAFETNNGDKLAEIFGPFIDLIPMVPRCPKDLIFLILLVCRIILKLKPLVLNLISKRVRMWRVIC